MHIRIENFGCPTLLRPFFLDVERQGKPSRAAAWLEVVQRAQLLGVGVPALLVVRARQVAGNVERSWVRRPSHPPADLQCLDLQRLRLGEPAPIGVRDCQVGGVEERVGVLSAQHPPAHRKGIGPQLLVLRVLALLAVRYCEVARGGKRGWVLLAI